MKSPEQQPTSQPEKSPADVEMDIDAAKKYLEEVYGPEKSSVIIDKSIPTENKPVEKEKIESMPAVPESKPKKPLSRSSKLLDDLKEHLSKPEAYSSPNLEKVAEKKEKIELPKPPEKVDIEKMNKEIEETKERLKETESVKLPAPPEKVDVEKMNKEIDEVKERQKVRVETAERIGQPRTTEQVEEYKKIREEGEKVVEEKEKTAVKELAERIKKEKAMQEDQIKTAKNELIDLAKSINEARENKETKAEISLYDRVKEVFEVATGKSLEKTAKEKAKAEAENEGLKIITPEEYRKEKTKETQERKRDTERSAVIKERWDMLSTQEKEKYFAGEKDKNDPDTIKSAINKFATELKGKIDDKRQELAKGKKGITISEDVFYELMKKGFKSEDVKKGGFFSKGGIEIPPLDKTDKRGPLKKTKEHLAEMELKVKKNIEEVAKEEIERKIIEGQRRWREKKQRHTREIIQETAGKYEAEKKLKVKPEKELQPEITEELKPFEKVSDIEKVMKKVNSDIEAKKEQQKRMQELKKKMKQGKILTLKEKAFLNKIDSTYRKEAEKQ